MASSHSLIILSTFAFLLGGCSAHTPSLDSRTPEAPAALRAPLSPEEDWNYPHIQRISSTQFRGGSASPIAGSAVRAGHGSGAPAEEIPSEPMTPGDLGRRWLYGAGFGKSIANVSTSIVFPPYALYLLGNSGLELAGLPTFYATNALPQKPRTFVLSFYDGITSVPGRIAALLAGEPYHETSLGAADAAKLVEMYSQQSE